MSADLPESPCPDCGGVGTHGLVHVRHGNGGGSNRPCPRTRPDYAGTILALQQIADDPTETPARRERARNALAADRADRLAWPSGGGGGLPRHRTSGNAFLSTLATEEGWALS